VQENIHVFNGLEADEKFFWEKDQESSFRFNQHQPVRKLQIPVKKSLDRNVKVLETNIVPKDMLHCEPNKTSEEFNAETRVNILTLETKKHFHEKMSIFEDLIPSTFPELPSLNNVVSMTIKEDSGDLKVSTNSKSMTENKILSNFLTIADASDLNDLLQSVRDLQTEVSSTISELSKGCSLPKLSVSGLGY